MFDVQTPDPLAAFTILIVCLAVVFTLFPIAAAIADHFIAPRRERRRLERLRAEIEGEIDEMMRRE